ncbi:MAG: hypothetical protein ACPGVE_04010 [Flavobacteriales bacterium]
MSLVQNGIVILFLSLFSTSAPAQVLEYTKAIKVEKMPKYYPLKQFEAGKDLESGYSYSLFMADGFVRAFLFDRQLNLISKKSVHIKPAKLNKNTVISLNNKILTIVFDGKSKLERVILELNFEHDSHQILSFEIDLDDQFKFLGQYLANNLLYLLFIEERTSTLNLLKYKSNTLIESIEFNLGNEHFPHFMGDGLYNNIWYNPKPKHQSSRFQALENLNTEDAFFIEDHKLYLVVNTHQVICIDTKKTQAKLRSFYIDFERRNDKNRAGLFKTLSDKDPQTRAYISKGKYFRINAFKEDILIQVFDIKNEKLLWEQLIDETQIRLICSNSESSSWLNWINDETGEHKRRDYLLGLSRMTTKLTLRVQQMEKYWTIDFADDDKGLSYFREIDLFNTSFFDQKKNEEEYIEPFPDHCASDEFYFQLKLNLNTFHPIENKTEIERESAAERFFQHTEGEEFKAIYQSGKSGVKQRFDTKLRVLELYN